VSGEHWRGIWLPAAHGANASSDDFCCSFWLHDMVLFFFFTCGDAMGPTFSFVRDCAAVLRLRRVPPVREMYMNQMTGTLPSEWSRMGSLREM
jgi:hypothetical protein